MLPRALELARDIAVNVAPVSAAMVKRNVYLGLTEPDRGAAHRRENKLFGFAASRPDSAEGAMVYVEKRDLDGKLKKNSDFPEKYFARDAHHDARD